MRFVAGATWEMIRGDRRRKAREKQVNLDFVVLHCDDMLRIFLYTTRDVKADEVLYYDYNIKN